MPADNEIYNQTCDIWWDEHQPLHAIRTSLNPARIEYFASAFAAAGLDPAGKVVVDVGCGGGLLAEEIARLGAAVIGVDPSANSIAPVTGPGPAPILPLNLAGPESPPFRRPAPVSNSKCPRSFLASLLWQL